MMKLMTWNRILTDEQELELVAEFNDSNRWTAKELSIIYKVSVRTVHRILKKHDVRKESFRWYREKPSRKPIEAPVRALKPCGTNAAYQRHRKAGEYPCTPCLAAHALNVKEAKEK